MTIAGIGFRAEATIASLRAALSAAGGSGGITALATSQSKAGSAVLLDFAAELGVPVLAISEADLSAQTTLTNSPRVREKTGAGSLAEAAALAATGSDARLLGPRAVSPDRMATAAIATGSSQ